MNQPKELYLNGERRTGMVSTTVAALVLELDLPGPALLIEYNGVALHRSEWEATSLKDGDQLEFVRIVAGG